LAELMSAVRRSVHTQKYLLSLCWVTTLPTSHAADGFAILLQEVGRFKFVIVIIVYIFRERHKTHNGRKTAREAQRSLTGRLEWS